MAAPYLTTKRVHQRTPGCGSVDPPGLEVEELILLQVTDSCPVRALDVICNDLDGRTKQNCQDLWESNVRVM